MAALRLRVVVILALAGISGTAAADTTLSAVTTDSKRTTFEDIIEIWRRRSERFRCFHFQWVATEWHAAGWMTGAPAQPGAVSSNEGNLLPLKDTSLHIVEDMIVDNGEFYHRREGPEWNDEANRFLNREQVEQSVPHGIALYASAIEGHAAARASIVPPDTIAIPQSLMLLPVMGSLRPIHATLGWLVNPEDWRLTAEVGIVNGRECVVHMSNQGSSSCTEDTSCQMGEHSIGTPECGTSSGWTEATWVDTTSFTGRVLWKGVCSSST